MLFVGSRAVRGGFAEGHGGTRPDAVCREPCRQRRFCGRARRNLSRCCLSGAVPSEAVLRKGTAEPVPMLFIGSRAVRGGFAEGHGFSRAANPAQKSFGALAPVPCSGGFTPPCRSGNPARRNCGTRSCRDGPPAGQSPSVGVGPALRLLARGGPSTSSGWRAKSSHERSRTAGRPAPRDAPPCRDGPAGRLRRDAPAERLYKPRQE